MTVHSISPDIKIETNEDSAMKKTSIQEPTTTGTTTPAKDIPPIPTTTPKRAREDTHDSDDLDENNNKRPCRGAQDVVVVTPSSPPPLFSIHSPELEVHFPDLENALLGGPFTAPDNDTPYIENWFLPNSPICDFDADSISVPDCNDFIVPALSELPYFEPILEADTSSNNIININQKELSLLDSEDIQFWSLLIGDGDSVPGPS